MVVNDKENNLIHTVPERKPLNVNRGFIGGGIIAKRKEIVEKM